MKQSEQALAAPRSISQNASSRKLSGDQQLKASRVLAHRAIPPIAERRVMVFYGAVGVRDLFGFRFE